MSKRKQSDSGDLVISLETPNTVGTALHKEATRKRQRKDAMEAIVNDPKNHEPPQTEEIIHNPSPGVLALKRKARGPELIPIAQRKNKGGRPRTKQVKASKYHNLKLRKNSPIKAEIPLDVWHQIFVQCPPRFLLKARTVHRSWFDALQYDSTWVKARQNHYGSHLPPPPRGITELQYADLLGGVGCQAKGCTDRKARKTYWGSLRRWCDNCLKKDLVLDKKVAEFQLRCHRFRDCVPAIRVDSWGHYQWVGQHNPRTNYSPGVVRPAYSRMAIENFLVQYEEFKQSGSEAQPKTEVEVNAWLDSKQKEAQELTKTLEDIEIWEEAQRISKATTSAQRREHRDAFFKAEGWKIDIPTEDMNHLDSFRRAIKISKAPHARCWEILRPKVIQEHSELLKQRKERQERETRTRQKKQQHKALAARRAARDTPEQIFVLNFADDVVRDLDSEDAPIADADLVPVIVRRIWDAYNSKADEEKPKDSNGEPYKLLMDDFRAIWEDKIGPRILSLSSPKRINTAMALACPINDCRWKPIEDNASLGPSISFSARDSINSHVKSYPEKMVKHVLYTHPEQVWPTQIESDPLYSLRCDEDGAEEGMFAFVHNKAFPWHSVHWPRNIPLLALHQKVLHWTADTDLQYQRRASQDSSEPEPTHMGKESALRTNHSRTPDRTMRLGHIINGPISSFHLIPGNTLRLPPLGIGPSSSNSTSTSGSVSNIDPSL